MSEQETTETTETTEIHDGPSPDETFWQRLMREFNEFIWPEEKTLVCS